MPGAGSLLDTLFWFVIKLKKQVLLQSGDTSHGVQLSLDELPYYC
jgi:hypothetical protein